MQAALGILVENVLMLLEPGNQVGAVTRAFFRLTERVELQLDAVETKVIPQARAHQDHFSIDIRTGKTKGLDADLMKLPVAALLRTLVAEHLAHVIKPLRRLRDQVVLDDGTHTARCPLGAQRQRFSVEAVDEGIHFFFDDIRHLADSALEQWRRFNNGHANRPVAIAFQPRANGIFKEFPEFGFGRKDVWHPAHSLNVVAHDAETFFL